jgi:hypothetical protein
VGCAESWKLSKAVAITDKKVVVRMTLKWVRNMKWVGSSALPAKGHAFGITRFRRLKQVI